MRTLLICHDDAGLDRDGLARWLASFSTLGGILVVREPPRRLRQRAAREIRRVGGWRFLDVLAFRLYYALFRARADRRMQQRQLEWLRACFPESGTAPQLITDSPNTAEAEAFIRECQPTLMLARCKTLLRERVFSIPALGTYALHPGICPEYRNAHGCFWAAALGDRENIGTTLLRIDAGVDTGPVFGHFRVEPEPGESHVILQHRALLDHLDAIRDTLLSIESGRAAPIETGGRRSATWGQPWLTALIRMNFRERQRAGGRLHSEGSRS
jgi:hypothetical protein